MYKEIIFHIDVNSAYLSWDAVHRCNVEGETCDLRDIPSVVGGDMSKRHGVVLAKSIPAKKYGIQTGEPLQQAFKKCPNLVSVPPRHDLYSEYSEALIKILREYSPILEQTSIDEAFLEMHGFYTTYEEAVKGAYILKDRVRDDLGFTVNIGVSVNKLLAKMASDLKKPDMVHTLFPHEIADKMWPLPIRRLYGIGKATEKKLRDLGIYKIGDLAATDIRYIKSIFKKQGEVIHNHANGITSSYVSGESPLNKGYGNSMTIPFDVTDFETAKLILLSLSETVSYRLRVNKVLASVICVELTDCNFLHSSHQKTLTTATDVTYEIQNTAASLLKELWDGVTPIRLLGVRAGKVTEQQDQQISLFDFSKHEKMSKLDNAIDSIRGKFGKDSIMRASFLDQGIHHMNGKSEKNIEKDSIKSKDSSDHLEDVGK